MDIKAYLPNIDFSLTKATLIELHEYNDSETSTITDDVVARVNAAMLVVFALGDVVVHAAVAVAKTTIAAVELPLYVAGRSGDFTGTATDVWCHTTHSIRSAITIFGSLAGLAKPQWTLDFYDWVALDVTVPKGLLAKAARQIREATRNVWNSPHRNLLIGCAVTTALVALGCVYSALPIAPKVDNGGGSTPPVNPNPGGGGLERTEDDQPASDVSTDGLWGGALRPAPALYGVGVISSATWWAALKLSSSGK